MPTIGATRQWIKFYYSTNTYSYKQYKDWTRASSFRIIWFFWVKNWSRLHTKNITQLIKKLNLPTMIRSTSPVKTNSNDILTNMNVTQTMIIVLQLYLYFIITISLISSHFEFWTAFFIIILFFLQFHVGCFIGLK